MRKILLVFLLAFLLGSLASAQDTITVNCSEDFYQADALFSVSIDGTIVSSSTACTLHNAVPGTPITPPQTITFQGSWGSTIAHLIKIAFLNDANGGTPATDRNLIVQSVAYNGTTLPAPAIAGATKTSAYAVPPSGARLGATNDSATYTTPIVAPPVVVPPVMTTTTVSLTVGLSCGSAPAPPAQRSVSLTWAASPTSGVTGYNVYRSTVNGSGYTKLTPAPLALLTYVDATIASGSTYFYVVTAVTPGGESGYSNQASAAIP